MTDVDKEKILIVDDEADLASILKKRVGDVGYSVAVAHDGEEAVAMTQEIKPNLILLDVMMPRANGIEVKRRLNENDSTANIPVIFLTAKTNTEDKIRGLRVRADDYVTKPFNVEELLVRIEGLLTRGRYYESVSMKDYLTGLPNAGFFKKELVSAFNLAGKYGQIFSVGILDLDNFKIINDVYGHQFGDDLIKQIANRMNDVKRARDLLSRYGGDEFAIIFKGSSFRQAVLAARRFKKQIENKPFKIGSENRELFVSLSAGVAAYDPKFLSEKELFELADRNMYADKNNKKNAKGFRWIHRFNAWKQKSRRS